MSRRLATVRRIAEIKPIEGADRIVAYRVDGWWVIGQKDQYKIDDSVIYLEIDSWVPYELAPFLSRGRKEPREFNGIKGERLKTIKMKGQLSQGLLLSIDDVFSSLKDQHGDNFEWLVQVDDDITDAIGIQLWEPTVKLNSQGQPIENPEARKGGFPYFIPKSDQERIQNCTKQIPRWIENRNSFEVTEKLHGSSMTVYIHHDDEGVCSRNINLKRKEDGETQNKFWDTALRLNLLDKLKSLKMNVAIQGELIGPGICGNIYHLYEYYFYLFNVWNIDEQRWFTSDERIELCDNLDIKHVPILDNYHFDDNTSISDLLELSDGRSQLDLDIFREGLVFKGLDTNESFKAISNYFLMRE